MTRRVTTQFLLRILDLYRRWLSPAVRALSPSGCKFRPTCSEFAAEAIALHGAPRGGWMTLRRLLRCHPFGRGGFDPVPLPRADLLSADGKLHNPLP